LPGGRGHGAIALFAEQKRKAHGTGSEKRVGECRGSGRP